MSAASSPGPTVFQGRLDPAGHRFAVVVSRYNESITRSLLHGALAAFREHQVQETDLDVAWVPGAWELPLVVQKMAASLRYAAVLALGAVIRGETTHDQYINQQVSRSLGEISLRTGVPVAFGLLTCNSVEQAIQRSGGSHGNKGTECALAALEMADLLRRLPRI
jgi:6,7-dimethyl-8-ribityllumazine synthase